MFWSDAEQATITAISASWGDMADVSDMALFLTVSGRSATVSRGDIIDVMQGRQ
jgi:hypothetical protein